MLVGDAQGGFGVRGGENAGPEPRGGEPLLERPPDGLLVVHDEDGVAHVFAMICEGTTNERAQGGEVARGPRVNSATHAAGFLR